MSKIAENIGDKANFLHLDYSDNKNLYNQLKKEVGYEGRVGFPIIIKCVDGKATEMIDVQNYIKASPYKLDSMIDDYTKKLTNKIEGTYKENPNKKVAETPAPQEDLTDYSDECTDSESAKENENNEELVLKKKLNTLKESISTEFISNIVKDISTDVLKDAIESAVSIDDLKSAVTYNSSMLDFETQISLSSAANNLSADADLDKAKESLLELIILML